MDLGLRSDDRVLVLGSSGWFGRELHSLYSTQQAQPASLWVPGASDPRSVRDDEIAAFNPTVVINFAFLTRERVEMEGEEAFVKANTRLIERFDRCVQGKSVRAAVTVSSGSAVAEPSHPYGRLKMIEESKALDLVAEQRSVVVIRAYSVSGGYVRRPRAYAFSDFLLQAAEGRIHVTSAARVLRRYCSVADALTVALRSVTQGKSGILETGGDLVEMGDLAARIRHAVNPQATIERPEVSTTHAQEYYSDNQSWLAWSMDVDITPADLDQQIHQAAAVLLSS